MKSRGEPRRSTACSRCTRRATTFTPKIRPDQFNQTLLVPITIARGLASAGVPVGDDETVLIFRRVGERVQLVRRNAHFTAPGGTPLDKSVKQNYTDSILMALPIIAMNPMKGSVLIDFSDIFMTDFAQLNLGMIDRNRSHWSKVKGFHDNMELEVETTFAERRPAVWVRDDRRRRRPPRHHRGHPLQPDEDARLRLPRAHGR